MEKIKKYLPYIILILGGAALFVRAYYSFCWSDETFYSATAYRFMQGDRIFTDEWFPTQLSSVVILPFMAIFKMITGSITGVILFLRLVYVVLSVIVSIVVFRILSVDKNRTVAYFASLMMLFYTHLNIATLSYYTISVECFMLSMLLIYHYTFSTKKSHLVVSGILFALSVLALPTMTVAYVIFAFTAVIICIISRKKGQKSDIETIAVFTLIGIMIPAVLFFTFMLTNVSVSDFIKGIPYVLSDEEHGTSLIFPLRKFFISINEVFRKGAYLSYLLILGTLFCKVFLKKLINRLSLERLFKYLVFTVDIIITGLNIFYAFGHTGYIQTVLCLFALPLYIITEDKDKKLFGLLYCGGMIFSLVFSYSSNGFLYVLSMGHAIAGVAAVGIIYDYAKETYRESIFAHGRCIAIMCSLVVVYVLAATVCLRFINVYRDAPLSKLTAVISDGPAKGLHTTPEHNELYNTVYDTITSECTANAGVSTGSARNIFITKLLPFGYMCTDLRIAAPTCWRTSFDSDRLREYYELNPEKLPDLILVLNEQYGTYDTCGDVEYDPNPNANEIGGWLEDYVNDNNFSTKEVGCGTLYIR